MIAMLTNEWRKSTRSENGNCVEARTAAGTVKVRDSKDLNGPVLTVDPQDWRAFLRSVA